jgi:hypothetical protein
MELLMVANVDCVNITVLFDPIAFSILVSLIRHEQLFYIQNYWPTFDIFFRN